MVALSGQRGSEGVGGGSARDGPVLGVVIAQICSSFRRGSEPSGDGGLHVTKFDPLHAVEYKVVVPTG